MLSNYLSNLWKTGAITEKPWMGIAKHFETGENFPEEVFLKLVAARTYRAGSLSLRQLKFATLDLELHLNYVPGGYAAGYYSYKAVEETGRKFRETVLALGGGKAPLEVFVEFRGREPSPEALLRHNGLLVPAGSA
ncbi:Organellar oligopeptidase A, chloroplastic/mitochondrial [Linum perenne]